MFVTQRKDTLRACIPDEAAICFIRVIRVPFPVRGLHGVFGCARIGYRPAALAVRGGRKPHPVSQARFIGLRNDFALVTAA